MKLSSDNVLKQMYSTIVARFDPKGYILDSLFAKGTISIQEKQRLEKLPDGRSAELVSVLLDSRRPNAISLFLKILTFSNEPAWKRISGDIHEAAKASSLGSEKRSSPMSQDKEISQSNQTGNG